MPLETGVNSVVRTLEERGFAATRHHIYLKPAIDDHLSYWALASADGDNVLITLGAIAPKINKFALGLLRKCSEGRIRPQFPAQVGPPIFITHSVTAPSAIASEDARQALDDFETRFGKFSLEDWFQMAARLTPYAPAQIIILPAYLYLKGDRAALLEYLSRSHLGDPPSDTAAYLDKLREMAGEP